jgi:high-affinity nickel permease
MISLLGLALLVGMHHALEADHVAAVSSLAAGRKKLSDIVGHGLTWGLGHTAALFLFSGAALLLGQAIPETVASQLEAAVGIMLVGLGGHVLWRLWKDRIHFHSHRHAGGGVHFHAHSHAGDPLPHRQSPHSHEHRLRWRTLLVGLMHGMAGSAALLVLAVSRLSDPLAGLAYILLFGLGSMAGMALVSAAIGLPLMMSARYLTWANRALQAGLGVTTILIGCSTIHAAI